jgi:hypothetical protein
MDASWRLLDRYEQEESISSAGWPLVLPNLFTCHIFRLKIRLDVGSRLSGFDDRVEQVVGTAQRLLFLRIRGQYTLKVKVMLSLLS